MKKFINNLRSWEDFWNMILTGILIAIIKSINGYAHVKAFCLRLFGVKCSVVVVDPKFGEKACRRH